MFLARELVSCVCMCVCVCVCQCVIFLVNCDLGLVVSPVKGSSLLPKRSEIV